MTIDEALLEAADYLRCRIPFEPTVAIVLGTGLSSCAEGFVADVIIPYRDIPHFPLATVETHLGNLLFGAWRHQRVVILQGRVHYYEGYSLADVVFPVRLMKMIGAKSLIVTNAAGGLDPSYSAGDIMIISDHINLIGQNPLRGPNVESLGVRFPSMHQPYSRSLITRAAESAGRQQIPFHIGVYVAVSGPSLETPAETRFLRMIGGDAVGMSTVPEVIAAVHGQMEVLGLSVISNVNIPETLAPAPLEDIIMTVRNAGSRIVRIIEGVLERLTEIYDI
ncbi:MAG TPA: purine-nucleoside phosphorylase [Thermodesulfobacteriota bacterium]|nr:purine-nucleoside phosphorylase [Deltaproteobacteria bacterium]HOC38875.1 purine-nucleoside phosphorylase [Thermodesulfobacteriota bacterium]